MCLCSFKAYGVDPKSPGMDSSKVITIESVPISEYWFRRIFMGTHRRESLYSQIDTWNYCAYEHGYCYCNGKVRFGDANSTNSWSQEMVVTGTISCNQYIFFGNYNPGWNVQKTCQCAAGTKIVPVEFRKSDVIWRFESACARVCDGEGV